MKKLIFDTNVYNKILDDHLDTDSIKNCGELYITNVQISELKNTFGEARRQALLGLIGKLSPIQLNLESGIWLDTVHWDDKQPWVDEIKDGYYGLLGNSTNDNSKRDALIGEVAKANG